MQVISYINPLSELTSAQMSISQAEQETAFAQQLAQLSIYGYADPDAARYVASVASATLSNQRQREDFWLNMIKEEKQSMKKAWELIKDS